MRRKYSVLLLAVILLSYAFLYIATKKDYCDNSCLQFRAFDTTFSKGRPYIMFIDNCGFRSPSDSICIYLPDTTGINFVLLADTACNTATSLGMPRQRIMILHPKQSGFPDTLVNLLCP